MPFKSKAQQRFMFKNHPKIAKEFAAVTDFSKLPERAKPNKHLAAAATRERSKSGKGK